MHKKHYIYTRTHKSYEDNIKLGFATHLLERNNTYKTGELYPGKFNFVVKLKNNGGREIEKKLQEYFLDYHIQYKMDQRQMNL